MFAIFPKTLDFARAESGQNQGF